MKILISSYSFYPNIGGIEESSAIMGEAFTRLGHQVRLITCTPGQNGGDFPFEILRKPAPSNLMKSVEWCDIFFHNNISLKMAWPLIFRNKPWIINFQTWSPKPSGKAGLRGIIKKYISRLGVRISVSSAINDCLGGNTIIIPNPYDDDIFKEIPGIKRDHDVIFAGRLVTLKGVDILLKAVKSAKDRGRAFKVTIAGSGPEEQNLKIMARDLGIISYINFIGPKDKKELAVMFNRHKVMALPSRGIEAYPLSIIEAISCGAVVAASDAGGNRETVGPCGVIFPVEDHRALADIITDLLGSEERLSPFKNSAAAHTAKNKKSSIAKQYLDIFEKELFGGRK